MEPESLAPYGYEVPDSSGVRDKLDTSANSTTPINQITHTIDRRIEGVAVSMMFVLATGQAPLRAVASQEMEIATTTTTSTVRKVALLLILLAFTTLVMAVHNRLRMNPQQSQNIRRRGRFHTSWNQEGTARQSGVTSLELDVSQHYSENEKE
eukprot:4790891-Amphidinium_carterae.1